MEKHKLSDKIMCINNMHGRFKIKLNNPRTAKIIQRSTRDKIHYEMISEDENK